MYFWPYFFHLYPSSRTSLSLFVRRHKIVSSASTGTASASINSTYTALKYLSRFCLSRTEQSWREVYTSKSKNEVALNQAETSRSCALLTCSVMLTLSRPNGYSWITRFHAIWHYFIENRNYENPGMNGNYCSLLLVWYGLLAVWYSPILSTYRELYISKFNFLCGVKYFYIRTLTLIQTISLLK